MDSPQRKLNIEDLLSKESVFISTKEGLSDVIPIRWGNDVETNVENIILTAPKNNTEE
ncbi:MAG: hypothetical protein FWG36_11070 [Oscillospiraceae bacterium]|nr:hypothetical protein [Oscillospiraceae bacterium]